MNSSDIFSVFIAEDEQPARDYLLDLIFRHKDLKVEGWAKNGEEALNKLNQREFDILFLDVNLPIISGIELYEKLQKPPYVIFTTAYEQYALKAFELGAVDYLLKPFSEKRFNDAVEKAINVSSSRSSSVSSKIGLPVKESENHYIIDFNDIIYVCSKSKHTLIYTEAKVYESTQLLKDICEKLPGDLFRRVHKQYVLNLKYISHVQYYAGGQYIAFLKDKAKTEIIVGRVYASGLMGKLTY